VAGFIPEPLPDFAFLLVFGSVYFGIVSRRRRPTKSKNPPKSIHPSVTIFGKTYRCIALQETNEL